ALYEPQLRQGELRGGQQLEAPPVRRALHVLSVRPHGLGARCLLPALLVAGGGAALCAARPEPPADVEARIGALLARMTLEEKLGQLQQLDGEAQGVYRPEHLDLARRGLLGSTLNVRGAANVNARQRAAVERARLQVPRSF